MNGASHGEPAGPIAYMASNRVAATLLMLGILAAGLVSLGGLEREAWPVVPFNTIEVSMAYPGATPHEIEESIVAKIEEELRPLEDVKAVKSVAAPGMASIRAELKTDTDIGRALEDIKSAVARIQSFPGAAERAEFREMSYRQSMIRLIVHGDISERALKELASQIEEELATLPTVSYVETTGTRRYEISVEVPLVRLRALGLTLADVAAAVRGASLDLSAGSIDTSESQVRVRTLGQRYDQQDFEDIVLVAGTDGTAIRLGDVATVHDAFEDVDLILRHQGNPAVFVEVSRADGEQVMDVAEAVHEHIAHVVVPSLPDGVGVTIWNDDSQTYSERLNLLLKNGLLGLALVMVALALFLEIRLAVWVVVGLLTAGIGALAVMMVFDIAINTISLFAFVLAIGIIVDDAIVVAEHIHQERMRGTDSVVAAIRGTRRIRGPLTFAVLTSVAAFVPLLYIPGGIGEVWTALPVILIGMLLISLVESLFILPKHLAHLPGPDFTPTGAVDRFFARTQGGVERALRRFIDGPLDRALRFSTEQPAVILASVIGLFFFTVSLLPAGIVPTTFADVVEGDFVSATIEMPDGTTAERTHEVALSLEEIGQRVLDRLSAEQGQELVTGVMISVGQGPRVEGGGLNPAPRLNPQANIATIEFKLVSAQERDISTIAVMQAWRDEVGVVPYARGVAFSGEVIDLGAPVEAVLSHPDPDQLGEIADVVVDDLRSVAGVFDVRSDHAPGVRELQLSLLPDARTLGFTVAGLARQVRSAFFGAEALRLQRGAEEVRVYVRLPEDERDAIADIEALIVQAPSGERVPLTHVAALSMGTSPPTIRRKDGQRVVTVTADVDDSVISGGEANAVLEDSILAELTASNPELTYSFGGEQQQQLESIDSLYRGFMLAMLVIFALLAIALASYGRPFIVMAIVPFGLIGVILGHLVLGVAVSAASLLGFFGLSGVVVNDSLVMIDFIDERLKAGDSPTEAIVEGAKGRFRPILLTSLTTFLGFTPLILERAIQAQFLVPFAASLGVGILVTTALLMVLIPALMSIYLGLKARTAPAVA
ncbi:MAG: efflux RND transporter permease subunit [Gammaproteobacteria bacterium]|nr:efflux RND transporter permease subunit [Gammaproteobacteria bacterium]